MEIILNPWYPTSSVRGLTFVCVSARVLQECHAVIQDLYPHFQPTRGRERTIIKIEFSFNETLTFDIVGINIRCSITYQTTDEKGTIHADVACFNQAFLPHQAEDIHRGLLFQIRQKFE